MKKNQNALIEYDLEIQHIALNDEILKEQGYKEIPECDIKRINMLIQYVPGLVTEAVERADAIKNSKELMKDAYKVVSKNGMHLAKSKATEGAFRGTLLSDTTNKVSGQAELLKIDKNLQIANIPKYALCVFDVLSVVTGQYFLSEINKKLSNIEKQGDRILNFLANEIKGELWADNQVLDYVIENKKNLYDNNALCEMYLNQTISTKKDVLGKIKLFELEIEQYQDDFDKKTKDKDVTDILNKIESYYSQYWYALYIYSKAVFCEIVLGRIDDPELLNKISMDLKLYFERYINLLNNDMNLIIGKLGTSKTYNQKKLPLSNKLYLLGGAFSCYQAVANMVNISADIKQIKKSIKINQTNDLYENLMDVSFFQEQIEVIDKYKETLTKPMDFVVLDNKIYMKEE